MDIYTILMILGVAGITAITALKLAKIRQLDPKHYKQQMEYYEQEAKSWRGRYNALNKQVMIDDEGYDLDSTDGIGSAVTSIADAFGDVLPKSVQKIIKDPKMMGMLVEYANKHPDLAKKVIDGFIKKSGKGNGSSPSDQAPPTESDDAA